MCLVALDNVIAIVLLDNSSCETKATYLGALCFLEWSEWQSLAHSRSQTKPAELGINDLLAKNPASTKETDCGTNDVIYLWSNETVITSRDNFEYFVVMPYETGIVHVQ